MISKALHPSDYAQLEVGVAQIRHMIDICHVTNGMVYVPHPNRLWEYGSVVEAVRKYLPRKGTCIDFGAGRSPLGPSLVRNQGMTVTEVDSDIRLQSRNNLGAIVGYGVTMIPQSLIEYRGEQADLVTSISVMEHLPPELQEAGWANLIAHVKSNGLLVATVDYNPNPNADWAYDTERETKFGAADIERIVEWLREAGFTVDLDMTDYGEQVHDYTFFRIIAHRGDVMIGNDDYVDVQRRINTYHRDGSIEGVDEPAIAWAVQYSKWIKATLIGCESILDAGCRTGYAMDAFVSQFPAALVSGVDIVPEFVKLAEDRGDVKVGDLQELPYADEEFDWVFCATAIEHCPNVSKAMSELCRVAKYGVRVITDLEDSHTFATNPSHFTHHDDPVEWVVELQQPGWRLIQLILPTNALIEMTWLRKGVHNNA